MERYEKPSIEVVEFDTEDVITTSNVGEIDMFDDLYNNQ